MALKLDFTGVERSQFLDREGECVFIIVDAEVVDAKSGESQNLVLDLEVEEPSEQNGQKAKAFINLSPKALWSARLFFEAVLGEPVEGELPFEDEKQLIGQRVGGQVIKNGKFYNVDTWINVNS